MMSPCPAYRFNDPRIPIPHANGCHYEISQRSIMCRIRDDRRDRGMRSSYAGSSGRDEAMKRQLHGSTLPDRHFNCPGSHGRTASTHAMRRSALPWLLVVALCLGGCSRQTPPNIVLIVIDTLRADRLGAYGRQRPDPVPRFAWPRGAPSSARLRAVLVDESVGGLDCSPRATSRSTAS